MDQRRTASRQRKPRLRQRPQKRVGQRAGIIPLRIRTDAVGRKIHARRVGAKAPLSEILDAGRDLVRQLLAKAVVGAVGALLLALRLHLLKALGVDRLGRLRG